MSNMVKSKTQTTNRHGPPLRLFPYRFLLRYQWPEHIEQALRRLMWYWLLETARGQSEDEPSESDKFAAQVCRLIAVQPETPPAVLDVLSKLDSASFQERIAENPNTWTTTLITYPITPGPVFALL